MANKDILQILCEKLDQLGVKDLDKAETLLNQYLLIEKHRSSLNGSGSGVNNPWRDIVVDFTAKMKVLVEQAE